MMMQRLIGIFTGMGFLVILMNSDPIGAADQTNNQTERNWQVGFSPSYLKGDYGTGSTTTITYLPISVRRLFATERCAEPRESKREERVWYERRRQGEKPWERRAGIFDGLRNRRSHPSRPILHCG